MFGGAGFSGGGCFCIVLGCEFGLDGGGLMVTPDMAKL